MTDSTGTTSAVRTGGGFGSEHRALTATQLLQTYGNGALQQMAITQGVTAKNSKSALIGALSKRLYERDRVRRVLHDLEWIERVVLDRIVLAGGEIATAVLRSQLEAEDKISRHERSGWGSAAAAKGSYRRRGSRRLEDIVARLGALGIVFTSDNRPQTPVSRTPQAQGSRNIELSTPEHFLFIPDAILAHLPAVSLPLQTVDKPGEVLPAEGLLARRAYLMVSTARLKPVPLTVRGQFPKRALAQLAETLHIEDRREIGGTPGQIELLRALLEEVGVLEEGMGGLRATDEARRFFAMDGGQPGSAARRHRLYEAYRTTERWSELARLPDVKIRPRDEIYGPEVVTARQRVLGELADLPAGAWISVQHLIDRLRIRAYEFLFSRIPEQYLHYYSYSYLTNYYADWDPYGGGNPMDLVFENPDGGLVDWEMVEGEFIRVVVDVLQWLGVLDLGWKPPGTPPLEPDCFRITEEGAALLCGGIPASTIGRTNVVIQPNFQILAFEPTGEDVLFSLDQLAERVRAEQVVEYRLTRESIYAAQRDGLDTATILSFLEDVSTTSLPQNVRRSIEDWGSQMERIVVRTSVGLLHAVDEATLDALYADPALAPLLGRRLAATAALAPTEHLAALAAVLTAPGHRLLPAFSEGDDASLVPAIQVSQDGTIDFRQRLPSGFAIHALHPFAEVKEDSMRLTKESLRRGAKQFEAEEIVTRLETMQRAPLPPEARELVLRYAKHWGRGTLAEVVVLQVETPEILTDLLAESGLGSYLQSIPGANTVATVEAKHVDRVRALLEERGMELESGSLAKKAKGNKKR